NRSFWMRESMASSAASSAVASRASPIAALSSSIVPYVAMRRSYFLRRSPVPSAVVPSSPVRVLMRVRTTIVRLFSERPNGDHDDHDGNELQEHAQSHQLLRGVRRAASHHIGEPEDQHDGNGADRDRYEEVSEEFRHLVTLTTRDIVPPSAARSPECKK